MTQHRYCHGAPSNVVLGELGCVWKKRYPGVFIANSGTVIALREANYQRDEYSSGVTELVSDNFVHLASIYTLPSRPRKGLATSALKELVEICSHCQCGILALVSPFQLPKLPLHIFDVCEWAISGRIIQDVIDPQGKLANTSKKLLAHQGFEFGFELDDLWPDIDFGLIERRACYLPSTMPEEFRKFMRCFKK